MKYVIIYTLDDNAEQHEVARCEWNGAETRCSGEQTLIANLEEHGITSKGKRFFPKDGLVFLETLAGYFRSGYLTTSEIFDGSGENKS